MSFGAGGSYSQNFLNRKRLNGIPIEQSRSKDTQDLLSTDEDEDEEFDYDYQDHDTYRSSRGQGSRPFDDLARFEASRLRETAETAVSLNHAHKKFSKRGKLVTFYRNGDPHFKGIPTSVSQKCFASFDTLLSWLNQKISLTKGARHVFAWPEGREVTDVKGFVGGKSYVVSSDRKLRTDVQYGDSKEGYWKNRKPSAGKFRKSEKHLLINEGSEPQSPNSRPRVLTIISNTNRDSREKVILNPQTNQNFEEMLDDITTMIRLMKPPVTSLYTSKEPYKKVQSFSQLFREFKDHDTFVACGREGKPKELSGAVTLASKREAPGSNSSNDSERLIVGHNPSRKPRKIQRPTLPDFDTNPSFVSTMTPTTSPPARRSYSHPQKVAPNRGQKQRRNSSPPFGKKESLPLGNRKAQKLGRQHRSLEVVKVDIHGRRREFYPPTYSDGIDNGERPDRKLKLDWVYGYRGRDARNNLFILPTGELLYYVASVAIVYDRQEGTQRHYLGHNEDITSMDLHPNEAYVATGQLAGETADTSAHVRVWDVRSLSTYAIIGLGVFQIGISCLSFSTESEGEYLMGIDESSKHVMTVWNWEDEKLLAKTTLAQSHETEYDVDGTTVDTVIWGCFHPLDDTTLISFGKQHIYFWKIFWDSKTKSARILRDKKSGIFRDELPKFVTAVAFSLDGDVITGDSSGRIIVWSRDVADAFVVNMRSSESMRHAHKKTVFSLYMTDEGVLISGGGSELKKWDSNNKYRNIKEILLPEAAGYVRSLQVSPAGLSSHDEMIIIGTTKNMVLEGSMKHKFKTIIQGHSDELWAMSPHPEEHSFITAGYDLQVCKWSAVEHRVVWKIHVEKPCLSVTFDPTGHLLAIGTTVGRFIVLKASNGSHVASMQIGSDQIDCMKYSPDGTMLAMGCHDGNIYLYDVLDNGQTYRKHRQGTLKGHRNFIMQLDWSRDGEYIQSVSGDSDQLYWDIRSMQQERNIKQLRDVDWSTQTSVLGYNVLGPWSNLEDGEDINCVARSNYRDYLVAGDNHGALRLYTYPCSTHRPEYYEKKHYSSHVTAAGFIFDDSYLITTGGADAGILQWTLVEPVSPR